MRSVAPPLENLTGCTAITSKRKEDLGTMGTIPRHSGMSEAIADSMKVRAPVLAGDDRVLLILSQQSHLFTRSA